MTILHEAIEAKKKELIEQLLSIGIYKNDDGRDLFELSLSELQEKFKLR